MPSLHEYLDQFASLARAPLPGARLTRNKYPNKPLLLLAVLDLIGSGFFSDNRIYLCPELTDAFDCYWDVTTLEGVPRNVKIPFEKLDSSAFWHLNEDLHPFTRARIARFDEHLFELAQERDNRAALQSVLIETYFAAELQPALRAATTMQESALLYSRAQLGHLDLVKDAPIDKVARSQAFRITVVRAYDYRCAICGIRIFSGDGRTAVEAAHIKPWHRFTDDAPDNGLSLCKLCHWAFDAGLLTVRGSLHIETSSRLTQQRNLGGHLMTTAQRPIFKPEDTSLSPHPDKLEWHRDHIFTP